MSKQDQEKLIKLLVKEMLEQDEELNEILGSEKIGNFARKTIGAVQRGTGIAQGLKQNIKQSWKAATGNEKEARAALDAKSKIKFDFLDKQGEIVKNDIQNAVKNAITKANSITQSSGAPDNRDLNKQYISQKMIQGFGDGSSMSDSNVLRDFGKRTTDSAKQEAEKIKQQFLNPGAAGSAPGGAAKTGKAAQRDVKKSIGDAQTAFENAAKSGKVTKDSWKQSLLDMIKNGTLKENLLKEGVDVELYKLGYTKQVIDSLWNDYISQDNKNINRIDTTQQQTGYQKFDASAQKIASTTTTTKKTKQHKLNNKTKAD